MNSGDASTSGAAPRLVVDAHTHIFPPDILTNREAHCERDVWFGELYTNPRAMIATADDIIESMDASGVDISIVCGFPWRDQGLCAAHNDYLADAARRFPDRLAWLATVVPNQPSAASEAERCFARGMGAVGIGELNADAQNFRLEEPSSLAGLVDVCQAAGRPILFHVSEPVGHAYPGKGTATPARLLSFLAAFPTLRVVAAHWGGGLPFYELMPEVAELVANLVYDTAASTYLYRSRVFRSVLDIVGPERVLMASDYPVLRQDRFVRRTLSAGLTDLELEPVLGLNAVRVYGLGAKDKV